MWPRLHPLITFADCWTIHLNSMTLSHSQAHYQNHARKRQPAQCTLSPQRGLWREWINWGIFLCCEFRSVFVGIIKPIKWAPPRKCEPAVSINRDSPGLYERVLLFGNCYLEINYILCKFLSVLISICFGRYPFWMVCFFCKPGRLRQPQYNLKWRYQSSHMVHQSCLQSNVLFFVHRR